MKFSEFLQMFYFPKTGGALINYKAKSKVASFFIEHGLGEYDENIIPSSDSTLAKWLTGERNPESSFWAEVLKCFDEGKLISNLIEMLNENNLKAVMQRFDIILEEGEPVDKVRFARAIATQFHAIASGSGQAINCVPVEYKKPPELKGFGAYVREAKRKFSKIKLPGGEERLLSDYFVCNSIGKSAAVFPYRNRTETIEKATLSKIRSSDRRGDIRYSILVGACGYGKTLMLQHLFLDAADHFIETGILPLFAELRNYTEKHGDLVDFITECSKEFDEGFSREKVKELMQRGQAAILFDGLDEMNPEEAKFFQKKLSELCHHFPSCQIVISSRQCSAIKGIRGFVHLYLHPLSEEQSQKLVENLLVDVEDQNAKKTILSFTDANDGYVRKNGFLATNPMLLTIMVRHYEKLRDCAGDKAKFYKLMYEALIREHDEEKESFDRFFHSVSNGDEFTQAFRELCALSYVDGKDKFDGREFEKYFKKLKAKNELQNPSIFQLSRFQHDVCATACVMYEQADDIYYIDPGLQDYFFSEYYYLEDTESTRAMGKALSGRNIDSFRNLDALKMLYNIAPEKIEVCVFLPLLDEVFNKRTDDEAFLNFLLCGYRDLTYTLMDITCIDEYMKKSPKPKKLELTPIPNTPKNIIIGFLLDLLGLDNSFIIGSLDESIQKNKYTKYFIYGYHDTIIDRDREKPDNIEYEQLVLRCKRKDIRFLDDTVSVQNGNEPAPLTDNFGRRICFGFVYTVDRRSLNDDPEQQKEVLGLCEKIRIREVFESVKQYYREISQKQEVNSYQ